MTPFKFPQCLTLLLLALLTTSTFAQKGDYILTDSTYREGIVDPVSSAAIDFKANERSESRRYSAAEINGYQVDGHYYQSFPVDGIFRFCKRLVEGEVGMFTLMGCCSVRQMRLLSLPKRIMLRELYDLRNISVTNPTGIPYSRTSLQRLVKAYNEGQREFHFRASSANPRSSCWAQVRN